MRAEERNLGMISHRVAAGGRGFSSATDIFWERALPVKEEEDTRVVLRRRRRTVMMMMII